jgi:hypothetical protein
MLCTETSSVLAISTGFAIGPFACSSREGARPSQNWKMENPLLRTVGALRLPTPAATPVETGFWSVNPNAGS